MRERDEWERGFTYLVLIFYSVTRVKIKGVGIKGKMDMVVVIKDSLLIWVFFES